VQLVNNRSVSNQPGEERRLRALVAFLSDGGLERIGDANEGSHSLSESSSILNFGRGSGGGLHAVEVWFESGEKLNVIELSVELL